MSHSKKSSQKIESRAMENNVRSSEQLFQTHSLAEAKQVKAAPKPINAAKKSNTFTGLHVRRRIKASLSSDSITGFNVREHMKAGIEVLGQGVKAIFGAVDIQMERENGRLRIEFIEKERKPVELLPLLESLKDIPPLTAVLGWSGDDQPVLLDLQSDTATHVLIVGKQASGKTTLLRALALSLAVCNKESRLQMIFLTPPKAKPETAFRPFTQLPHLLAPISTDPHIILETLDFLVEEIQHRQREAVSTPAITVFADNLPELMAIDPGGINQTLTYIIRRGAKCGIHLVLATDDITHPHLTDLLDADVPARLVGQVNSAEEAELATDAIDSYAEHLGGKGDFLAAVGDLMIRFQAADIADKDLNFCVDHIQRQRPPSLLAQDLYQQTQQIQLPDAYHEATWYAPSEQESDVSTIASPAPPEPATPATPRVPLTSAVPSAQPPAPTPPAASTPISAPPAVAPSTKPVAPTPPAITTPVSTPTPQETIASPPIPKAAAEKAEKSEPQNQVKQAVPEPQTPKAAKPAKSPKPASADPSKSKGQTAASSSQMKHMASIFASLYPHSATPAADLGKSAPTNKKVDQSFRSISQPPPPPPVSTPSSAPSKPLAEKPTAYQKPAKPPPPPPVKPTPAPAVKQTPQPLPEESWFEEESAKPDWEQAAPPAFAETAPHYHFEPKVSEVIEQDSSPLYPFESEFESETEEPHAFYGPLKERPEEPPENQQPLPPALPVDDSPFFSKLDAVDIAKFNQPPPPPPPEPTSTQDDPWLSGLLDVDDNEVVDPTAVAKPQPLRSTPPPTRPTPAPHSNPRDLIRVVTKLGRSKPVPKPSSQSTAKSSQEAKVVDPQSFIESQALPDLDDMDVQVPPSSMSEPVPEVLEEIEHEEIELEETEEPPRTVQKPRRVQQLQRRPKSTNSDDLT